MVKHTKIEPQSTSSQTSALSVGSVAHNAASGTKRIVIDARYVTDRFPGIGRYVYNLLAALATLDQPHRLLVLYNPAQHNSRYNLTALSAAPSISLVATTSTPMSLAEQVRIPLLLRQLKADLYHSPYYLRPYIGLPCPAITTLYDTIPRRFPAEVAPRARLLFGPLSRLAISSSQHVLAISQSTRADLLAAFGLATQQVRVTHLAADPHFAPQPPAAIAALRTRYQLPEHYVLYLGSNKPHKNLVALVEAWGHVVATERPGAQVEDRKLKIERSQASIFYPLPATINTTPSPTLVLAGHWDARYPAARQVSERLGLDSRVRFLPDVAEQELAALYAGATVFVYPSLYEGFGLPPLEAMACGTPVICGSASSLPEVVGDAALQADVSDPAALAAAITRVLGNAPLRHALRAAGLAQAARFSWQATAQQTLAVYAEVLGSSMR